MHKHYIYLLFSAIMLSALLCACNTKSEEATKETPTTSVQSNTEVVADSSVPTASETVGITYADELQIQADLIEEEENYFFINNESIALDIESVEILRRKSDNEYDEVHVFVEFSNPFYHATADYILYYSYYTTGGWCLDDYELLEYQCEAIACPASDADIVNYLTNHFSSCQITNRSHSTDSQGVFTDTVTFTATLEYPYFTTHFSGWYTMQFYNNCWYETYDFTVDNYDWSKLEDSFRWKDDAFGMGTGSYSGDVKITLLDIEQVGERELSVTYSASVYLFYKSGGYIEENETIPQKTKSLQIFSKTVTILGKQVKIPSYAQSIFMPWYGTFEILLDTEDGVEAIDSLGRTFAHFDRTVSDSELQDAFDRLEQLNP